MRVQLGESKLKSWADNKAINLSKSGSVWLTMALDPYHDNPLPQCDGWPDVSTASSVVSCVKQTMQISATSGGASAPTNNWDAHIALVPDLQGKNYYPTTYRRGNQASYLQAAPYSTPFGGLMARAVFTSGQPVDWMAADPATTNLGRLELNSTYGSGLSRVIAVGFEVHNTTAELYKQGAVVYYRQPEPKRIADYWRLQRNDSAAGEIQEFNFSATPMRLPPTTAGNAMQLANSREFKAKDGAYIVAAFHSNENEPLPVGYNQPVWFNSGDEDQLVPALNPSLNNSTVYIPRPTSVNPQSVVPQPSGGTLTVTSWAAQPVKIYPFHQCGAIFTGLSPQTTLTVNMIVYVETFPPVNTPLTVLATPSARYDPTALEIYSKALSRLPTGVPVRENGLGQWFSDVINDIEPFMTPMLTMLHPAAGAVSKGIGVANQAYRAANGPSMLPAPKKKKKTKSKNSKLDSGSRGKKNNIQGPMRQGK